jgi:NitT/TauT family transport system ATP-binding protein
MPAPAAPSSPVVTLKGVTKTFPNGTAALGGLDLEVRQGEFLSLLGPSGCGKSTALRLIAGLSEPSTGEVLWPQTGHKRIGFVFQEPTLMPWATVWDNVYLPLCLQGQGRGAARQNVDEMIQAVGLAGFERVYPRELSGGMRMRVSIARALVTDPDLLLLDEPFAALDEITRLALNDDLLRLWERHRPTILFVTHSVFESVYLSTRIAVMSARPGRIAADLPVALPQPRGRATRMSADYAAMCEAVSATLAKAMSP